MIRPRAPRRLIPSYPGIAALVLHLLVFQSGTALGMPDLSMITLAAGGGVTWLPDELEVEEHTFHVGGIIGFTMSPSMSVELRSAYMSALPDDLDRDSRELVHLEANGTWFASDRARFTPLATAGVGLVRVGGQNEFALNAGGGVLIRLSDELGVRVDARDIAFGIPGEEDGGLKHSPEIFAGFAFGLGAPPDDDFDAVSNSRDDCPDTPVGAVVDEKGCPKDADMDGVPDGIDTCDSTVTGAKVDAKGCPVDTDKDKVFDGIDKCPGTPTGVRVDATGCPLDTDKDGVFDGLDKCADTPAGTKVDSVGCPVVVPSERETELRKTGMIRIQDIKFETGKADISPESFKVLDEVGEILTRLPQVRMEIGGHSDSRGSSESNQKLSEARAQSVLNYLATKFPTLKRDQFTAVGYGESQPIDSSDTEIGMAKNRRVEFKVLNAEVLKPSEALKPSPADIELVPR